MTNAFGAAQLHYRFAEENGTEATSTLLGSEDTALSRDVIADSNIQLRILINEVGGGSVAGTTNASWQLQRSIAGGGFANVTTSSTGAKVNTGSGLTDQGATTNRLTAPTTFAAGKQEEGDGAVLHTHAGNVCTEHVFALTLVAADLANGNALTFKLLYQGADLTATQNGAYTVTPTLNITKDTTAAYTQVSFVGKADDGNLGISGDAGSAHKVTVDINTNFSQITGEKFRLRYRIQQTNAAATSNLAKAFKLKVQVNGTGGFVELGAQGAAGVKIRYADSPHFSDNAAIGTGTFASHLGSGTGTAIAGVADENGNTGTITFSTGAASHTELEFALELVKGQAVVGDTFEPRVYETNDTPLAVYTATPTVTALAVVNTGEPGDPDFDHSINAGLKLFVGSHPVGDQLGTERVAGGTITTYGSAAFTADHPDRPWKALAIPGTSADGARTPITAFVDDCHVHYTIWADVQVDSVVSASKLLSVPEDTSWSLPWAKLAWGRSLETTQQQHIVTDTHPTHENTATTQDNSFPTSAGRYRIWMRRNGAVLQVGLGASQVGSDVVLSSTEIRIGWLVATQPINFLNRSHTSTGEGLAGKLYQLRMLSRVLSDTELADLDADPLLGVNAPAADPAITSIDGDDVVQDGQAGVIIEGSSFGASETGSAKVEISNNATYGSGTVVELDATAWSATSITMTMRRESDAAALGTLLTLALDPAYLWVTSSTGERNATAHQFALQSVTTVEIRAVEWNAQWTDVGGETGDSTAAASASGVFAAVAVSIGQSSVAAQAASLSAGQGTAFAAATDVADAADATTGTAAAASTSTDAASAVDSASGVVQASASSSSEPATAAAQQAASAATFAEGTEPASAAATQIGQASAVVAIADAAEAGESPTGDQVILGASTAGATADEAANSAAGGFGTSAEAVAADEAPAGVAVAVGSQADATGAADATTASGDAGATTSDAAIAAETGSGSATVVAAFTDGAIADATEAAASEGQQTSDSTAAAAAGDAATGLATASGAGTELAEAALTTSSTVGGTTAVQMTDGATAAETAAGAATALATSAASILAAEAYDALTAALGAISEASEAGEAWAASVGTFAATADGATATEATNGILGLIQGAVVEGSAASAAFLAAAAVLAQAAEQAVATALASGAAVASAGAQEAASAASATDRFPLTPATASAAASAASATDALQTFWALAQAPATADGTQAALAAALAALAELAEAGDTYVPFETYFIRHVASMLITTSLAQSMAASDSLRAQMTGTQENLRGMVIELDKVA